MKQCFTGLCYNSSFASIYFLSLLGNLHRKFKKRLVWVLATYGKYGPSQLNNSCCACYITGHRKHIQFPISGTHFTSAPAPNTGKAPLPPHRAHPAPHTHPSQELVGDPTHPSSKKATGILAPGAGHCRGHQPLSLHQVCISPPVKSYLYAKW